MDFDSMAAFFRIAVIGALLLLATFVAAVSYGVYVLATNGGCNVL